MRTKNISYKITTDPKFLDDQNAITPELSKILHRYHHMALDGKKSSVSKMLDAIENHPKNPQLKNYLSVLYGRLNEAEKMYETNKWIIAEHPDYLFGKLNLANEYYLKQEYDKIPNVLGDEIELQSLYPNRDVFHLNEVTSFLKIATLYFAAIENIEEAEIRYDLMKQLAPDSPETEMVRQHLFLATMKAAKKRYQEEEKSKIKVTTNPQRQSTETKSPKFNHKEINDLYTNGLYIEKEKLDIILSLPRKTLIEDLELVLMDSINRFSHFQKIVEKDGWIEEKMNFVIHAIFILGELRASCSLNSLFEVLSQSDEYLDFYLDDYLTELLWEPLVKIGGNSLQECKEYLFKPGVNKYARCAFSEMVVQIALHHPNRFNETLNWYKDIIHFFLNSDINDNVIDSDLIALMICDLIDINGEELLPEIEKLYDKGIVSVGMCGSWQEVNEAFERPEKFDKRREILSIFDRYKKITSTWAGYIEEESFPNFDLSNQFETFFEPIVAERKIGRNEQCPCGSGKKYKKCCINI